jgi:hypothetical protein
METVSIKTLKIRMAGDKYDYLIDALNVICKQEQIESYSQALELIVADFMAGYDSL